MSKFLAKLLPILLLACSTVSAAASTVLLSGSIVPLASNPALAATPQQIATQAVLKALARPNLPPPTVQKLTLQGQYGLATWLMGEAGGLVALVNKNGTWKVIPLGGGVPDAANLSQRSGIPVGTAQSLLSQHLAKSVNPFASLLPQLKRQTKLPILLPITFPFQQPMHGRIEAVSVDRYSVSINYTADCRGTPCNFAYVDAEQGGQFTKPSGLPREIVKPVTLRNNIPGVFINGCGAYCTAFVEWKSQGVLYRVSIKNGREADVVMMANAAIASELQVQEPSNRVDRDCEKLQKQPQADQPGLTPTQDKCR